MTDRTWVIVAFLGWLAINGADAVWIYFYVMAEVLPVPHNAIDRSTHTRDGYMAMMIIFGFVWSSVNFIAACGYFALVHDTDYRRRFSGQTLRWLTTIFVAVPVWAFMIVMPFAGGWIVTPLVKQHAWKHWCDSYPMFVILDGTSYYDASYVVPRAYFYINSPSASEPTQLFTYELSNPGDGDTWLFGLRSFDEPQFSIPLDSYPTLQQIYYNYNTLTVAGNCTIPDSIASNTSTTTIPCVSGTFDPGARLTLSLNSSVPLNSTLSTAYPSGVEVDAEGNLGHLVLKTTVTKPRDATELKVCVAGALGREAGTVAAEVLAPLGVALLRQDDFARYATQPNDAA
ncbi:hypothetical protein PHLGIDRAFT_131293 [Phlebiopsis gigantea 11061_1 CR5-6]|uniref:Uncharacterized protein n=1 Tax=Phlebiopsis gigantea (strain 11061_1 CR5-6) TaxID=745531 RepID=A0A0C3RPE7_PHLG1|nr:hypothetical protein PHLGIDRAFT_131293 [Phlebiopsis gigantea 11061_1 CR5-6]